MAHLRCDVFSTSLGLSTSITVLLPEPAGGRIGMAGGVTDGDPPVLWLLHGLSDDDTTWVRRTSVERYVAPLGLAVVMPQVHRSLYLDGAHTGAYWTWLSEELPALVQRMFRVSDRREDTFVAGLSMGGYGAMRLALHRPDRFAAAASMSGLLDLADHQARGERTDVYDAVFAGRRAAGTDDDLLHLLGRADPASLPTLHVSCGTDDPLLDDTHAFLDAARDAGVAVTEDLRPGTHEWGLWDAVLQDVLAWLPLTGRTSSTAPRTRTP